MKKLFVALLSIVCLSAQSQTAEEVIQQYTTVMGGLDSFNKINTAKITGMLTSQGQVLPLTTQIVNGKAMRTDVKVGEQYVHNVYKNGTGWKINPFANAPTSTDVTGSELVTFKAQASLANNLMDYKKRGHQAELLAQQIVDGSATYPIKLTSKEDGKVTTYFINTKSHLLVKSITKREIAGVEYDAETFYKEIKEVNGLKFSTHFVQKVMGQVFQDVKYEKIELNIPVDEKIFEK
ncbi:MAG: hypothetical protein SGI83_19040 [Bacteroidota bacterium]|nr:hypothetical protein [Bacteroidota bacterium]